MKCRNKYKKYLEQEYKRIVPLDEDGPPREIEIIDGKDELLSEPQEEQERSKIPESESEKEKAKKRKTIDEEWDEFHREHEERDKRGQRFPEFDDVPFKRPPESIGPDDSPALMADVPNPYEPRGLPREVEDDRMSDGHEPTEVPETFEVLESPESPMDLDIFQKVPKGRKNRNHGHLRFANPAQESSALGANIRSWTSASYCLKR